MNVKFFNNVKKWSGSLIYGYLAAMFSLFLFFYRNFYFDLTPAKYAFFQAATLLLIGAGMILSCLLFINTTNKVSHIKGALRNLSITDWGFLLMLCSHIITTLVCEYPSESLSGIDGRQSGLIFTFLITSMYFLVSRWYQQEVSVIFVYLISSVVVISLGLLNFYGFDPLHFSTLLSQFDVQRYLSTMGNIQFFAHLICLSLPISVVLFTHAKQKNSQIIYAIFTAFGFAGLYISNIDGGFLGILAFMAFYLYNSLSTYEQFKKYIIVVLIALSSGQLLAAIATYFPDTCRGFFTLSQIATSSSISTVLLVMTALIYIFYVRYKSKLKNLNFKNIRKIYLCLLFGCIFIIASIVFYLSAINTTTEFASVSNYLRYNDKWGTGRGFIWNHLLSVYTYNFDFIGKLFGSGLDTVRTVFLNSTNVADVAHYDNAHNEYVQYLVTSGFFGLFTYLLLFISIQVRLFKHSKSDPFSLAILCCLIAHGAQAITGLNQPITTPLLYILISIGENLLRSKEHDVVLDDNSPDVIEVTQPPAADL